MNSIISNFDSKVMVDESSKCCMGETYNFYNKQIHKIQCQTQRNKNLRLLAKTSIRIERYFLRKLYYPRLKIRKSKIMIKDIEKIKKMVRKCGKVICKKNLLLSDINNEYLTVKLGQYLTNKYQQNGYFDIIKMMLDHSLPHERYFSKTHKHHHHKHHHKHHKHH